jgi:hypothetical protein
MLAVALILATQAALAQRGTAGTQTAARLSATTDTVALGRPIRIALAIQYPGGRTVLLPDTLKGYGRFEYGGMRTIPGARREADGWVYDSIEVTLRSFNAAAEQKLAATLGFVRGQDTLRIQTNTLTFRFNARIPQYDDKLALKKNFDLAHITPTPNYLLWFIIAFSVIGVCVVGFFVLQKPVRLWLRRRRLQRQYDALQGALQQTRQLLPAQPLQFINQLNGLWKDYLDYDWRAQLRTQTAREVSLVLQTKLPETANRNVLQQLCTLEEQVNYARRPLPNEEALALCNALNEILAGEYARRKEAAL